MWEGITEGESHVEVIVEQSLENRLAFMHRGRGSAQRGIETFESWVVQTCSWSSLHCRLAVQWKTLRPTLPGPKAESVIPALWGGGATRDVTMCDSFVLRFFKDGQCPDVAPLLE